MALRTSTFKALADFSELHREAKRARAEVLGLQTSFGTTASSAGVMDRAIQRTAASSARASTSARDVATHTRSAGSAAREAASGMDQASDATEGFATRGRGLLAQILGVVRQLGVLRVAGAGVLGTLAAIGLAAGTMGVMFNSTLESAHTGFVTLLKDEALANDLMERIIETARVTPFETTALVTGVRRLLAYGFQLDEVLRGTGASAEGLVISFSNAVAAMGGSQEMLNGVIRAIGQIRTRGQVMGEELMQIAEQGIPVYEILQQKLGLTGDQVGNIGKLGIKADVAIKALAEGLDERFGGALEAQSKTMAGLISTLRDNVSIGLGTAFKGVFDTIKEGLSGFNSALQGLVVDAKDIGLLEAIERRAPLIGAAITAMAGAFDVLRDTVVLVLPLVAGFLAAFSGSALAAATGALRAVTAVIRGIVSVLGLIPDSVLQATGAALGLVAAFKAIAALNVFGRLLDLIRPLVARLLAADTAATALAAAQGRVAVATQAVTVAQARYNAALAAGTAATDAQILAQTELVAAKARLTSAQAAQTAAQAEGLLATRGFGAGLLAFLRSPIVLVTVALGALTLAYQFWRREQERARASVVDLGSEAVKAAKSLGLQTKALGIVKDETGEAVESTAAFRRENARLLEDLGRSSRELQQAKLVQVAYELELQGLSLEERIKVLKQIAEAADIEINIDVLARNAQSPEERIRQFGVRAREVAKQVVGDIKNAADGIEGLTFGFDQIGEGATEQIRKLAAEVRELFGDDLRQFGAGIALFQEFAEQVRAVESNVERANHVISAFGKEILRAFKGVSLTDFSNAIERGVDPTRALMDQLLRAKDAPAPLKEYIRLINAAEKGGLDLAEAIAKVNSERPDLAAAAFEALAEAENKAALATGDLTHEFNLGKTEAEAYEEKLKDLATSMRAFADAGKVFSEVLDEAKDQMREVAEKEADAENKKAERARKAALKALEEQIDAEEKRNQRELDSLRARQLAELDALETSGQANEATIRAIHERQQAENLAHSERTRQMTEAHERRREELQDNEAGKKSWEDYATEVEVSLEKVAKALQEKLDALEEFNENTTKIAAIAGDRFGEEYGEKVALAVREMDPSGQLAKQIARGDAGALELLDQVKRGIDLTSDQAVKDWSDLWSVVGVISDKESKKTAFDIAQTLGLSADQVQQLAQRYGEIGGVTGDALVAAMKEKTDAYLASIGVDPAVNSTRRVGNDVLAPGQTYGGGPPPKLSIEEKVERGLPLTKEEQDEWDRKYNAGLALGGVLMRSFAMGGRSLPDQAMVARPKSPKGLVQWAEPETEGEAFIPLARSKREGAARVWEWVGQQFGFLEGARAPMSYADGGLSGADVLARLTPSHVFAGGGILADAEATIARARAAVASARHNLAAKDHLAAYRDRSADIREALNQRISHDQHYRMDGVTIQASDPEGLFRQIEERARLAALVGGD